MALIQLLLDRLQNNANLPRYAMLSVVFLAESREDVAASSSSAAQRGCMAARASLGRLQVKGIERELGESPSFPCLERRAVPTSSACLIAAGYAFDLGKGKRRRGKKKKALLE